MNRRRFPEAPTVRLNIPALQPNVPPSQGVIIGLVAIVACGAALLGIANWVMRDDGSSRQTPVPTVTRTVTQGAEPSIPVAKPRVVQVGTPSPSASSVLPSMKEPEVSASAQAAPSVLPSATSTTFTPAPTTTVTTSSAPPVVAADEPAAPTESPAAPPAPPVQDAQEQP